MTQNKNPAQQGGNINQQGREQQSAATPRDQNPANPNPRSDEEGKKQGQMGQQTERGKQHEQQNPRREENPNVNQPNREQDNARGRANEDQGRKQ